MPYRESKHDRRALTEHCRAPRDFARLLLGGAIPPADFARHLANCPACRKVLLDLSAAAVGGEWPAPDPSTRALARMILAEKEGKEEPPPSAVFRLRLSDPIEAEGPESAVVRIPPRPGGATVIRTGALGAKAEIILERTAPGRFLLRFRCDHPGAVLRLTRDGTPVGKGQDPAAAVWRDLGPGAYLLAAYSKSGERFLSLVVRE